MAAPVDIDHVVGHARYVKSREQITCLRRPAAIAAAGIEKMIELAKPGQDEGLLYARVMQRMVELGSEYYPMAFYSGLHGGGRLPRFEDPPEGRMLQPMYRIANEVDAVVGGLIAQEQQPIYLGAIRDDWKPAIELQRDMYCAALEHLVPGRPFADVMDTINNFGAGQGMKTQLLMHGCGYGDDGPLFSKRMPNRPRWDLAMAEGCAFVWKPAALSTDEKMQFVAGGPVLVTRQRAVSLFKRSDAISVSEPAR